MDGWILLLHPLGPRCLGAWLRTMEPLHHNKVWIITGGWTLKEQEKLNGIERFSVLHGSPWFSMVLHPTTLLTSTESEYDSSFISHLA